jgi:hypothetical protein
MIGQMRFYLDEPPLFAQNGPFARFKQVSRIVSWLKKDRSVVVRVNHLLFLFFLLSKLFLAAELTFASNRASGL